MSRTGAKWAATLTAFALLSAAAVLLGRSDLSNPPRFLPRCVFHEATGWHCPGCGNTRAAHALLHADFVEAFRQNALSPLFLPFLGFLAWRSWLGWIYPDRLRPLSWRWTQTHTRVVVSILLGFWVLRNLPWAPFSWLAPDPPKVRASPESGDP